MTRLLPFVAISVIVVGCSVSALAQSTPCVPVLADGKTEFVKRDHVPAYPNGYCYTFGVRAGQHVSMTLTPKVDMEINVEVREPGAEEYRDLLGGITSFSNTEKMGRIIEYANTDTEPKEFRILIAYDKRNPDTSKEFEFRIFIR